MYFAIGLMQPGALALSPGHPTAISRYGFAMCFRSLLICSLNRMVVGLLLTATLSLKDLVPQHNSPLCLNMLSSR